MIRSVYSAMLTILREHIAVEVQPMPLWTGPTCRPRLESIRSSFFKNGLGYKPIHKIMIAERDGNRHLSHMEIFHRGRYLRGERAQHRAFVIPEKIGRSEDHAEHRDRSIPPFGFECAQENQELSDKAVRSG